MELHGLQELPGRVDQPHPDLGLSAVPAAVDATGVLSDNIMEQHVTLSLGKISELSQAEIYK